MNPYRETPYAVGDSVEFVSADGFHLPFGTWTVDIVDTEGRCFVANGWSRPSELRRSTSARTSDE